MTRPRFRALVAALALSGTFAAAAIAEASVGAQAGPPVAEFSQRLDAPLPLERGFTDDTGAAVRLGDYFGTRPVVLVLGYYLCPNLCTTTMQGVLESVVAAGLAPQQYAIVAVSIDPAETSALAARKKASYAPWAGGASLHLLTGNADSIAALAAAIGFPFRYDAASGQFAHPAGFIVATPGGRIAHYLLGVRFDPRDVRLALVDAARGTIGSPVDRLLLACAHFDPRTGRYNFAVMQAVRAMGIVLVALLGGWMWRRRRHGQ